MLLLLFVLGVVVDDDVVFVDVDAVVDVVVFVVDVTFENIELLFEWQHIGFHSQTQTLEPPCTA